MKKNTKNFISEKYSAVYKQCVLKYFAYIKSSEGRADFFKLLAMYCHHLVQNSKNYRIQQRPSIYRMNMEKIHQDFLSDTNKVLWRRNFIDAAFLFGYDKLVTDKAIVHTKEKNADGLQAVLNFDKLATFLFEVEQIIRKNEDFETIAAKLKCLFQHYNLSFIEY